MVAIKWQVVLCHTIVQRHLTPPTSPNTLPLLEHLLDWYLYKRMENYYKFADVQTADHG